MRLIYLYGTTNSLLRFYNFSRPKYPFIQHQNAISAKLIRSYDTNQYIYFYHFVYPDDIQIAET